MLSEKYKNALSGFKYQARGDSAHHFNDCKIETNHLYKIIMTEGISVLDMDEATLESFLEMEKLGEKDYSKYKDCESFEFVDFEQDVNVYPYPNTQSHPCYWLKPKDSKLMFHQLLGMGQLELLGETLQSLCQRKDGTKLLTAFPDIVKFKQCIEMGLSLPKELVEKINDWESSGQKEVVFDFVQKNKIL